jgi:hypothetical protein
MYPEFSKETSLDRLRIYGDRLVRIKKSHTLELKSLICLK